MGTVHIGICHDHNFIITEFCDVEIVSVSFGKSTAKGIDHCLDLGVGKHFIDGGLLYVQNFPSDRENGLIITVAGRLCGAAGGISLYNKDFTLGRIFLLAVCQFAVGVKRVFLFGEKICLGSFFCFTDFSCFFCTGKDCFQGFQVSVKVENHLLSDYLAGCAGCVLVVQFCLGLSFESGFRMFDGDNCGHSITDVCTCEVRIFIFQNADFSGVGVHYCSEGSFKSGQMCAAFCIVNVVTEAEHILTEFVGKLKCHFYLNSICFSFQINRIVKYFCTVVQVFDKSDDSVRFMVSDIFCLCTSAILEMDGKIRIQIGSLMETAFYFCCRKSCFLKNLRIREKVNAGSGLSGFSQFRKKSFFQFECRDSTFIMVMMDVSVTADPDVKVSGQCVYN